MANRVLLITTCFPASWRFCAVRRSTSLQAVPSIWPRCVWLINQNKYLPASAMHKGPKYSEYFEWGMIFQRAFLGVGRTLLRVCDPSPFPKRAVYASKHLCYGYKHTHRLTAVTLRRLLHCLRNKRARGPLCACVRHV